jgi:hypothetical protein
MTKTRIRRTIASVAALAISGITVGVTAPPAHAVGVCGYVAVYVLGARDVYVPIPCSGPCGIGQGPNDIGGWPLEVKSLECYD